MFLPCALTSHSLRTSSNIHEPKGTLALTLESASSYLIIVLEQHTRNHEHTIPHSQGVMEVCTSLDVAGVGYLWGKMGTHHVPVLSGLWAGAEG